MNEKHNLSAGHIDWNEWNGTDNKICVILDDATRMVLVGEAISREIHRSSIMQSVCKSHPEKSIDHLRLISVALTISHPDDAEILKEQDVTAFVSTSSSDLRMRHMIKAVFLSRKILHYSLQPASVLFKEI